MRFVGYMSSVVTCFFLSQDTYFGDGDTDRREGLNDGKAMSWTVLLFLAISLGVSKCEVKKGCGWTILASQTPIFAI